MGAPGFDDAPMTCLAPSGTFTHITFCYPYYENAGFLREQVHVWNNYPDELRRHLSVNIVDDGSPDHPAVDVLRDMRLRFSARLFRIGVDVRWNWLAARNIAVNFAHDWCLLTDMDHVVPQETLRAIMSSRLSSNVIYRFSRREHTGEVIHPHPNSMLMRHATFWRVGGYDEALSGHYGTDGDWRRRCAATAPVFTLPCHLLRYEYQGDSSTTHYLRKQPEDAGKKAIIAKRGPGWRPKVLSFPYEEIAIA